MTDILLVGKGKSDDWYRERGRARNDEGMKEVGEVKGEGGEVIPGVGPLSATEWEE